MEPVGTLMTDTTEIELKGFREEVSAWFSENKPADPGFLLPETFMEVGTDSQFEFLRDWQRKVYEAGFLGMAWPEEYGGRGMPQVFQDIATQEMASQRLPFMPNTIGLNWAGPLILKMGSEEDKRNMSKIFLAQKTSGARVSQNLRRVQILATPSAGQYAMVMNMSSTVRRYGQLGDLREVHDPAGENIDRRC